MSELSDEMLAVLCRRIFRMRDDKMTAEDAAEELNLTVDEMYDVLEEARERGIII